MRSRSQRARVLGVIALAVLPLVVLVGLRIAQEYREDKAGEIRERLALAQTAAFAAQVFIENQVAMARSIALHPALAGGRATPELREYFERVARVHPEWAGVGALGSDGYSFIGTLGGPPIYLGDRPYFKEAIASGAPVVSSAVMGRRLKQPTIVIAVPFELAAGGRGALLTPLPTERFAQNLLARVGTSPMEVVLIDREGSAFLQTGESAQTSLPSLRGKPAAEAILRGESGSALIEEEGAEHLVVYAPVPVYGWGVLLREPAGSAFAEARAAVLEHALWLTGALALVGAIGWILGGYLERALRSRDQFLAAAAHDLRNPLSILRVAAEGLQHSLAKHGTVAPSLLAQSVRHIERASRRMGAQIDAFLDVARIEMGAPLELRLEPLDLAALVRPLVEEYAELNSRHRVSLEAPEPLRMRGDASRLQRAIGNVLHNAIKYSPEGGEVEVRAVLVPEGGRALLSVRDCGIGVPPEDRARIFRRFERGSNVVGRIPGSGIGLAGARQIIEQHGGTISVQSRVGQGTTFTVTLPLA